MAKRVSVDRWLFTVTMLLVFVGLVMVFSASAVMAKDKYGSPYAFLLRQVLWAVAGLVAMVVAINDGVVDDQLHEQGTDDREHFENRAQQEELGQDPAKSRHPSHELSDAHLTPLRLGLKPIVRCELQGHTREVGRKLSHADRPATESGVEDDRRLALDRDEHNEMTQIPVEDRGKAQSIHRLQLTA